jgi:hypothetical protein
VVGPGGLGGNLLEILQKKKEVAILSAVGADVDLTGEEAALAVLGEVRVTDGDEIVLRERPPRLRAGGGM